MSSRLIRTSRTCCSGFTLLEMMVALAVMSIAIIAMLQVVVSNVNATANARDRTIAASLAQAKLHDIEMDRAKQTGEQSGNFGDQHRYFSWTSVVQASPWPEIKRVAVTVYWIRGKKMKQLKVETLIRERSEQPGDSSASSQQTSGRAK